MVKELARDSFRSRLRVDDDSMREKARVQQKEEEREAEMERNGGHGGDGGDVRYQDEGIFPLGATYGQVGTFGQEGLCGLGTAYGHMTGNAGRLLVKSGEGRGEGSNVDNVNYTENYDNYHNESDVYSNVNINGNTRISINSGHTSNINGNNNSSSSNNNKRTNLNNKHTLSSLANTAASNTDNDRAVPTIADTFREVLSECQAEFGKKVKFASLRKIQKLNKKNDFSEYLPPRILTLRLSEALSSPAFTLFEQSSSSFSSSSPSSFSPPSSAPSSSSLLTLLSTWMQLFVPLSR